MEVLLSDRMPETDETDVTKAPRLSGMLRAFLENRPFNEDSASARRHDLLQKRHKQYGSSLKRRDVDIR